MPVAAHDSLANKKKLSSLRLADYLMTAPLRGSHGLRDLKDEVKQGQIKVGP